MVVVWDNLSVHKDARLRAFIDARDWITAVHLPPYAPDLNPVEGVWSLLRRSSQANTAFTDLDHLSMLYVMACAELGTAAMCLTGVSPPPDCPSRTRDHAYKLSKRPTDRAAEQATARPRRSQLSGTDLSSRGSWRSRSPAWTRAMRPGAPWNDRHGPGRALVARGGCSVAEGAGCAARFAAD
ncbi:transposase [Streptomyces sp. NPDC055189]